MAKIENTTAYPNQSPVTLADYLIGTDAATLATKTFTVQDIADALDEQVTLQEVLNASDPAGVPNPTAAATGNIELTGSFSLVTNSANFQIDGGTIEATTGNDLLIANKGSADDIILGAGNISGDIKLVAGATSGQIEGTGAGVDFTVSGSAGIDAGGDIDINAFGVGSDIQLRATDKAFLAGGGSSYGSQPASSTMVYNSNGKVLINSNGDEIIIGGTYPSRPTAVNIGPVDGNITLDAFSAGSQILLNANSSIVSVDLHQFNDVADLKADNGLLLNGVAGTDGDILVSQGGGLPLVWENTSDLTVGAVVTDVHIRAASTLANFEPGTPVYVSGAPSGPNNYPTVDYASPSPTIKMPAIGLIVTATGAGNDAKIMMSGELEVDTTRINGVVGVNDIVYVDDYDAVTSPLCLTVTRPSGATTQVQNVGVITKVGANGSLKVSAIGRSNDLPNISANQLWAGNVSGVAEAQDALTVDIANSTVNVGNGSGSSNTLMDTVMSAQVVYGDAAGAIGIKNLQYGIGSLQSAIGGSVDNTALGINSLQNLTTGISNVAVGNTAGNAITTTNNNIAIGNATLDAAAGAGNENVAVGGGSMGNTTGAGASSTVAIGHNALNTLTTGANNTAVGHSVGFALTNGQRNVIIGRNANFQNGGDSDAVVIGHAAIGEGDSVCIGVSAEAGAEAVAVGREANAATPTTGSTAIGYLSNADVDCIALGKDANAVQRGGNPMLAIPALIAQALANAFVYPDNNAAVAAGLQPGDAYCVDFGPFIPGWIAPPAGGPAVLAFVY